MNNIEHYFPDDKGHKNGLESAIYEHKEKWKQTHQTIMELSAKYFSFRIHFCYWDLLQLIF